MATTFEGLPMELKLKIYRYALMNSTSEITASLKLTCKEFYVFYNELFHERLHHEFGDYFVNDRLSRILDNFIKPYIKSFDYWRRVQRQLIADFMQLSETEYFYKDSYQLIYSIFKNRRLFATYEDYRIDEPIAYNYNNFVSVNRTYLLSYDKTIELAPDTYNLACGIIVENALGLSTTKFQILDHETKEELLVYYPPSNINDILPKDKFVLLNLGDFKVVQKSNISTKKLVSVDVIMEETGLYIKSGFSICFIDINAIQPNHTDHIIQVPVQQPSQEATPALHSTNADNSSTSISNRRRRSSISLNSSMAPVQTEDFNFHNFLFWYVENDVSPPYQQHISNVMLKNIYKAFEMSEFAKGEIQLDANIFDVSPYNDIENYNHNFFSKYCIDNPNEKIKRVFKFITIIQQRNYDMEVAKSAKELELRRAMGLVDQEVLDKYSPLKWKMQTLLQL